MIRWPFFVIGLGLMVCALVAKFQQPPLASKPLQVSVSEAVVLSGGSVKNFVELTAEVDTDRRIYSTGGEVSRPVYTAHPPDQVYSINVGAESGEREKFLGNMVRVEAGPDSHLLRLQTVRDRAFEEKQVLRERLLAPVPGSAYRLWALSAVFSSGDPQGNHWISQRKIQGYLTRFKDLEANRSYPKFQHDTEKIYRFAEKEYGQAIPENAYVLLTDFKSFPQPVSSFYCPIKGSRETLFCDLTPSTVTNMPGVLRGILEPAKLELYADFERVLNMKLPARLGILTPGTAESSNERTASGVREVAATGSALASLGFIGIVWERLRKSRKQAKAGINSLAHTTGT